MEIIPFDAIDFDSAANLFTSKQWLALLRLEYGFDFYGVVRSRQNKPLLLFAKIDDLLGKRIISLPFSDYTEPEVADGNELLAGLGFLRQHFADHLITLKLLGCLPPTNNMELSRQAFCHRINLQGDLDSIWQKTSKAFKKGVRKSERLGLKIKIDNSAEGLDKFYQMLVVIRRFKFNILPQAKSFYARFLDGFLSVGAGNLWFAYADDQAVAAAMIIHHGNGMFDKMGVSDPQYLACRPNNFLLWKVMSFGHHHKFSFLDMGLTPVANEGLLRFKDSLGGVRSPINYYSLVPASFDKVRQSQIKELIASLTTLLVRPGVPNSVVEDASTLLYRFFA